MVYVKKLYFSILESVTFLDFNNLKSFDEIDSFLFGKGGRGKEWVEEGKKRS